MPLTCLPRTVRGGALTLQAGGAAHSANGGPRLVAGATGAVADTATRVTVSGTAATGGSGPVTYQIQHAQDAGGSPGTWADVGPAQTKAAGVAPDPYPVEWLFPNKSYWWRHEDTDAAGTVAYSAAVLCATLTTDLSATALAHYASTGTTGTGLGILQGANFVPDLENATSLPSVDGQLNHDGALAALNQARMFPGESLPARFLTQNLRWYRDVVVYPLGDTPGYQHFSRGQALHYERTGDTTSRDALILLRNAAYCNSDVGHNCVSQTFSRECAYSIWHHVECKRLYQRGLLTLDWNETRLATMLNSASGHIDKWCSDAWVTDVSPAPENYIQAFMMGLTCWTLGYYVRQIRAGTIPVPTGAPSVTTLIRQCARILFRLRNRFWDTSVDGPFNYIWDDGSITQASGHAALNSFYATPAAQTVELTGDDYWKASAKAAWEKHALDATVDIVTCKQFNELNARESCEFFRAYHAPAGTDNGFLILDGPVYRFRTPVGVGIGLTVKPVGNLTGTVTLSDGAGGSFSFTGGNTWSGARDARAVTYTPAGSAGARTITMTNTGGFANAPNTAFTAT